MSHEHECMKCGRTLVCFEEDNGCQPGWEVTCDECVSAALRLVDDGGRGFVEAMAAGTIKPQPATSSNSLDAGTKHALRMAGAKVRQWTAERDRLIKEAVAAGGSLLDVEKAVGLTRTAVKLIAQDEEPEVDLSSAFTDEMGQTL